MRSFFVICLAVLFLTSPAFADQIKADTSQSELYQKTKNRYYRPTPLPKFKLEWPRFEWPHFDLGDNDLGDTEKAASTKGDEEMALLSRKSPAMPRMDANKQMTQEEAMQELQRLYDLNEAKKRDLDAEIKHLQEG